MQTKFKLIGLARNLQKFTLETNKTKDIFWMYESHLSAEQYNAMFDLVVNTKGVWQGDNFVIIDHDGFNEDGETPINPKLRKVNIDI